MKKKYLVLIPALSLMGCSKTIQENQPQKDWVECYSISIYSTASSTSATTYRHTTFYTSVCEYNSADNGKVLYSNFNSYNDGLSSQNVRFYLFESSDAAAAGIAFYSKRFIGFLHSETKYYLNVKECIIEQRTVYSKIKIGDYTPPTDKEHDNSEAYDLASNNLFIDHSFIEYYNSIGRTAVFLNTTKTGLSFSKKILFKDLYRIEYVPMA